MADLSKIYIYPVKSLEGLEVENIAITAKGALNHDREFALVDDNGKFINGKKYPSIHFIRAIYNLQEMFICLSLNDKTEQTYFNLLHQQDEIGKWFSEYFNTNIRFIHNPQSGFPDDTDAYGPTIVSRASIKEVAGWFSFSEEEIIKRFRPNLIIEGTAPFWEDMLYGVEGEGKNFSIGEVSLKGTNPCNRCVVPTRNQDNSEQYPDFQKIFMDMRKKYLPEWAVISRFNHFYKFCVNTQIPYSEEGKTIKINDQVSI